MGLICRYKFESTRAIFHDLSGVSFVYDCICQFFINLYWWKSFLCDCSIQKCACVCRVRLVRWRVLRWMDLSRI